MRNFVVLNAKLEELEGCNTGLDTRVIDEQHDKFRLSFLER